MNNNFLPLLDDVSQYYTEKVNKFGANNKGVDWNSTESQYLRFKQLATIINTPGPFSICDFGCGYGAFYDYLLQLYSDFNYLGIEISSPMLDQAKKLYPNAQFSLTNQIPTHFDYVIASGVFNVRLHHSENDWYSYIQSTLLHLNAMTTQGFAFNCLTSYSDKEHMKESLYYANPGKLFDFCKTHFSKNVALLHDYNLYEFTILVRK